jgi:GT2 family glycosyltransferase
MASDVITKPISLTGPRDVTVAEAGHSASRPEPRVVILVLNWNNAKDTLDCLVSLRALVYKNYGVLVLDNGSTDDSVAMIRAGAPDIEVLELGRNLGFGGANNVGMRRAMADASEYVWLLNNDTTVDPNALSALVASAEANAKVGAVGSAVFRADQPTALQAWGGGCVNFWLGSSRHFTEPVPDDAVEFLTAASVLLRTAAIAASGAFDEKFFFYWEDAELCFRLRRQGWRLAVAGGAKVWHRESATAGRNRDTMDLNFSRSSVRFFKLYSRMPSVSIGVSSMLRLVKRAMSGEWSRVRAVWNGLTTPNRQS